MDELPPAEELPALYRAILDRVDRLERAGDRHEAARIRRDAIRAYSESWDVAHRRRLEGILRRVERALEGRTRAALGTGLRPAEHAGHRRRSAPLGRRITGRREDPVTPPREYALGVPETVETLVAHALRAHAGLTEVADAVEEEAQYVADLGVVWRARLQAVATARRGEAAASETEAAIEELVAEAGRIDDPHRAIDWLSTLPQAVLVALGEPS